MRIRLFFSSWNSKWVMELNSENSYYGRSEHKYLGALIKEYKTRFSYLKCDWLDLIPIILKRAKKAVEFDGNNRTIYVNNDNSVSFAMTNDYTSDPTKTMYICDVVQIVSSGGVKKIKITHPTIK